MADTSLYFSPIGALGITVENGAVTRIFRTESNITENVLPLHLICIGQLTEYFEGKRTGFTVPIDLKGTEFQKKVRMELLKIPYGHTRSYSQIAAAIGNPKASRAVGQAVHNNPVPIIVPCHRVISASGTLGGFAWGVDVKKFLLEKERGQS